jgi:hypothetical protein
MQYSAADRLRVAAVRSRMAHKSHARLLDAFALVALYARMGETVPRSEVGVEGRKGYSPMEARVELVVTPENVQVA